MPEEGDVPVLCPAAGDMETTKIMASRQPQSRLGVRGHFFRARNAALMMQRVSDGRGGNIGALALVKAIVVLPTSCSRARRPGEQV